MKAKEVTFKREGEDWSSFEETEADLSFLLSTFYQIGDKLC